VAILNVLIGCMCKIVLVRQPTIKHYIHEIFIQYNLTIYSRDIKDTN